MPRILTTAALILAAFCTPVLAQDRAIPASKEQVTLTFAPVVKKAAPAVVNIFTERRVQTQASPLFDDPFFQRFFGNNPEVFGPRERVERSLGSGVIVRDTGVVVTNHHVAAGADQIRVVLSDGRERTAEIVGTDERTDLCVLQLKLEKGESVPALPPADSDNLEVGDLVLAIGNPFDVGQTVTSGIVSALGRSVVDVGDFRSFIQTDAAINPGNSGGALVTSDGRLVGINTAIYSRSGGSIGIGFAIPSNMVKTVVASILKERRAIRPWIGAVWQSVTPDLARNLGLARPRGAAITRVLPGGPGAGAGLKAGDVVLKINGRDIADEKELRYQLATLPVGTSTNLVVNRDGAEVTVSLPLRPPPDVPARDERALSGRQPFAGATVANLNPALADELNLQYAESGVIVRQVARGSVAARLGLQVGDLVVEINRQPVASVAGLVALLGASAARWEVAIKRGDQLLSATVES